MKNLLSNDTKISYLRIFSGSNLKSTGLSYTTGTSALPDIYAQARGPQARVRVHIYRQSTSAHGITNMFYFST